MPDGEGQRAGVEDVHSEESLIFVFEFSLPFPRIFPYTPRSTAHVACFSRPLLDDIPAPGAPILLLKGYSDVDYR